MGNKNVLAYDAVTGRSYTRAMTEEEQAALDSVNDAEESVQPTNEELLAQIDQLKQAVEAKMEVEAR